MLKITTNIPPPLPKKIMNWFFGRKEEAEKIGAQKKPGDKGKEKERRKREREEKAKEKKGCKDKRGKTMMTKI